MALLEDIFNTSSLLIKIAQQERASRKLISAAESNDLYAVKNLLKQGVDINKQNSYGDTALIASARYGYVGIVDLLIEHGADVNRKNDQGDTALIASARSYYPGAVKSLLNKGAFVDVKNQFGETALMVAVRGGHAETVERLISKGANIEQKNKAGESLVEMAEKYNKPEIAVMLQEAIDVRERLAREAATAAEAARTRHLHDSTVSKQNELKNLARLRGKPKRKPSP